MVYGQILLCAGGESARQSADSHSQRICRYAAHFIGAASGEHHHGIRIASSPPPSFLPVPPQPSSSFLLFVLLCSVQFAVVFARLASDTKEQRKKARRRPSRFHLANIGESRYIFLVIQSSPLDTFLKSQACEEKQH